MKPSQFLFGPFLFGPFLFGPLLALLLPFAAHADTAPAQVDAAKAEAAKSRIEGVIEAFRTAIIDRNEARFTGLFLHDHPLWQNVTSDAGLQIARQKNPQALKVRVDPDNNYRHFIQGIVASKRRIEEKFHDVRIDTDGDIASVYFNYSFHVDERETNHGREAWQLINTGEGWKIVSVIWSVTPTPPAKTP